jgi:hypothetical protein
MLSESPLVREGLAPKPVANDYFVRPLHFAEHDLPFAVRVLRCANSASGAPVLCL